MEKRLRQTACLKAHYVWFCCIKEASLGR